MRRSRSSGPPSQLLAPVARSHGTLPRLSKGPSPLQWLPPNRLDGLNIAPAERGAEEMVMASWLKTFGEHSNFGSGVVFLELQLRQALTATQATDDKPDAFRTACVCECLTRLIPVSGSSAGVLALLKDELMRAVYVGKQPFGKGTVDAQTLLSRSTYFFECAALHERVASLEERLSDWTATKEQFMQDADGRNELLRLAVARWNAVLATLRETAGNTSVEGMQDTARKLASLLDSMLHHSKAIDELQRVALLEPVARMHTQYSALGSGTRKRLLLELMATYAPSLISQQAADERSSLLQSLIVELDLHERQRLIESVALNEGIVGHAPKMVGRIFEELRDEDKLQMLRHQVGKYAARVGNQNGAKPEAVAKALRELVSDALAAVPGAAPLVSDQEAQAGSAIGATREGGAQTQSAFAGRAARAELLAEIAAEVGSDATAALPSALEVMDAMYAEERKKLTSARVSAASATSEEPRDELDHRMLVPLIRALDLRCAEHRQEEARLRAEVARLRGSSDH